jgi:FkbM family methyltransferase
MNPSAPVTSTVRSEKTSAKSEVRPANSSSIHTLFVSPVTGGTIARLVRRFVVALGRLAPPSLRQWLRRTRFGRAIGRVIDEEGSYEPEVLRALGVLVRPGETCADVGAHRGVITRQLARLVGPTGRVIAFEAHPDNARELERALAAEDLDNRVRVENLAVTDGSRTPVPLHAGRRRASAEWNIVGADLEGRPTPPELEVPATSLDAYFESDRGAVDLVKIDVEGAEGDVLAGMRRLLREGRPELVLEFHNEAGWQGRSELFDAGYDLYEISGARLDPAKDVERRYHCLALPRERPLTGPLG